MLIATTRVNLAVARWFVAFALLAAFVASPGNASAQTAPFCDDDQAPAFVFGLADLKAALGAVMGDPVECEHTNTDNGDTLQQTTTGLAIYRPASNTPEFTDGWNHWALTPRGVVAWSGTDLPGAPPQAAAGTQCVDIGGSLCLNADPEIADTVTLLSETTTVPPLLRAAAQDAYSVEYGRLPPDVLGLFRPSRHQVIISSDLRSYSAVDRGPVLAHELQHVSDWISLGQELETSSGCLATESNAFHTESVAWLELHDGRLPAPDNGLEREFNTITRAIQTDPTAFADRLTLLYHDECSVQ